MERGGTLLYRICMSIGWIGSIIGKNLNHLEILVQYISIITGNYNSSNL